MKELITSTKQKTNNLGYQENKIRFDWMLRFAAISSIRSENMHLPIHSEPVGFARNGISTFPFFLRRPYPAPLFKISTRFIAKL